MKIYFFMQNTLKTCKIPQKLFNSLCSTAYYIKNNTFQVFFTKNQISNKFTILTLKTRIFLPKTPKKTHKTPKNMWKIHCPLLRMYCRWLREPAKHSLRLNASAHSSSICWSPHDCVGRFCSSSITVWKSRSARIFCDHMRRNAAHT